MIPEKLKDDAIIEVVCQVQFASPDVPEVLVGRLSDFPDASGYELNQLPLTEIPAPIRRADPALRAQPLLQLKHADGRLMQIGERVMSAHVVGVNRYPGWKSFRLQVKGMVQQLFGKAPGVRIESLSLRYINALVKARHSIDSPQALNLQVAVANKPFDGPINLAFVEREGPGHVVTTRIADTAFVQGPLPGGTSVIVDVEVVANGLKRVGSEVEVLEWIETAHDLEKRAFFKLIPREALSTLVEE